MQQINDERALVPHDDNNERVATPRLDTIDEMEANLHDNSSDPSVSMSTPIITPITPKQDVDVIPFKKEVVVSKDKLCFISYQGANTLRSRWYLVQIRLDADVIDKQWSIVVFGKILTMTRKETTLLVTSLISARLCGQIKRSLAGSVAALS